MKLSKKEKIKIKGVLMFCVSALCITSCCFATYTWFMTTRNASVDIFSITCDIPYFTTQIKWFRKNCKAEGNELTGYPDPISLEGEEPIKCDDYNKDFLDFGVGIYNPEETGNYKPYEFYNILPRNCLTFAIEIQNSTISTKHLNMFITKLTSNASTKNFLNFNGYNIPFRLVWNMEMYVKAYDYDANNVTDCANDFIVNYMSKENYDKRENKLNYGYEESFDNGGFCTKAHQILKNLPVNGNQDQNIDSINKIIFFTIEMGDKPIRHYSAIESDNTKTIWKEDPNGNSNAFKELRFVINKMLISPVEQTIN